MSLRYYGSENIVRGERKTWDLASFKGFKLTEDCRLSINASPLFYARDGEEFEFAGSANYVFDRDTTILVSYADASEIQTVWENQNVYNLLLATGTLPESNIISLSPSIDDSGWFRISFSSPLWHTTDAEDIHIDFSVQHISTTTDDIMDTIRIYLSHNMGYVFGNHSVIVNFGISANDMLNLTAILTPHIQIAGSDEKSQYNKIKLEKLPVSISYTGAYDLSYNHNELKTIDTTANETTPTGIFASKLSGTKLYIVGSSGDAVDVYTMSTKNDTSTATYSTTFSVSAQDSTPQDVFFNDAATMMFIVGSTNDSIYTYTLSTPDSIASASYTRTYSLASKDTTPVSACFTSDGLKMWMAGQQHNKVYEYSLSSAHYTPTMSSTAYEFVIDGTVLAVRCSPDGMYLFVMHKRTDPIATFITRYTINGSIANYENQKYSIRINRMTGETNHKGMDISDDGKKIYIIGSDDEIIREIALGY